MDCSPRFPGYVPECDQVTKATYILRHPLLFGLETGLGMCYNECRHV